MVRKGGFEPPRLSAPPPQDGVSASSTTSAKNCFTYNVLAPSYFCIPMACAGFRTGSTHAHLRCSLLRSGRLPPCKPAISRTVLLRYSPEGARPASRLNVIVSGDVLQREGSGVLPGLGQIIALLRIGCAKMRMPILERIKKLPCPPETAELALGWTSGGRLSLRGRYAKEAQEKNLFRRQDRPRNGPRARR